MPVGGKILLGTLATAEFASENRLIFSSMNFELAAVAQTCLLNGSRTGTRHFQAAPHLARLLALLVVDMEVSPLGLMPESADLLVKWGLPILLSLPYIIETSDG